MWYVYRLQRSGNSSDFVRVVAKNVDDAIWWLRAIEGESVAVIEADREFMLPSGDGGPDGNSVHYVADSLSDFSRIFPGPGVNGRPVVESAGDGVGKTPAK